MNKYLNTKVLYNLDKETGIFYINNKKIDNDDEIYKIYNYYKKKIMPNLTNIKFIKQSLESAHNNLVFVANDGKGTLQYFYGNNFIILRNKKRIKIFIDVNNKRKQLDNFIYKYIDKFIVNKNFLFAVILLLEFKFYIRIGKDKYYNSNGTVGILTLKRENIHIDDEKIIILFQGKKKQKQEFILYKLKDKKLYDAITFLYNQNNVFLFSYNEKRFTDYDLSLYLNKFDINFKDLRTYGVNILYLTNIFKEFKENKSLKKMITNAINLTAKEINHGATTSKNSYILEIFTSEKFIKKIYDKHFDNFDSLFKYIIKILV